MAKTKTNRLAEVAETFGERLARLRNERGITATELAFAVGKAEGWLRHLESGQIRSPAFQIGVQIAKALGVSAEYLAFGTGEAEVKPAPGARPLRAVESPPAADSLELGLQSLRELVEALSERQRAVLQELHDMSATQEGAIAEQRGVNATLAKRLDELEAARRQDATGRNH